MMQTSIDTHGRFSELMLRPLCADCCLVLCIFAIKASCSPHETMKAKTRKKTIDKTRIIASLTSVERLLFIINPPDRPDYAHMIDEAGKILIKFL